MVVMSIKEIQKEGRESWSRWESIGLAWAFLGVINLRDEDLSCHLGDNRKLSKWYCRCWRDSSQKMPKATRVLQTWDGEVLDIM